MKIIVQIMAIVLILMSCDRSPEQKVTDTSEKPLFSEIILIFDRMNAHTIYYDLSDHEHGMYKYRRGISSHDTVVITHTDDKKLTYSLSELMNRQVVFDNELTKEAWARLSKGKVHLLLKEDYLVNGSTALDYQFQLEEVSIYFE